MGKNDYNLKQREMMGINDITTYIPSSQPLFKCPFCDSAVNDIDIMYLHITDNHKQQLILLKKIGVMEALS
jgi:hypothetical protein